MVERRSARASAVAVRRFACGVISLLSVSAPAAPQSAPSEAGASGAPKQTETQERKQEPRRRLRIDVEKHVERVLEAHGETPRFETTVEVEGKSPEAMFESHLRGFDLECGPTAGGAPTEAETRAVRPHPSPYVDLAALAQVLMGKLKGKGKGADRYYLYRVRRGGEVSYALREEKVPESSRQAIAGTTFELIETFDDLKTAAAAWRRLERGFEGPLPTTSASPTPPWVTANCRPPED
jgi:hypothetical protein